MLDMRTINPAAVILNQLKSWVLTTPGYTRINVADQWERDSTDIYDYEILAGEDVENWKLKITGYFYDQCIDCALICSLRRVEPILGDPLDTPKTYNGLYLEVKLTDGTNDRVIEKLPFDCFSTTAHFDYILGIAHLLRCQLMDEERLTSNATWTKDQQRKLQVNMHCATGVIGVAKPTENKEKKMLLSEIYKQINATKADEKEAKENARKERIKKDTQKIEAIVTYWLNNHAEEEMIQLLTEYWNRGTNYKHDISEWAINIPNNITLYDLCGELYPTDNTKVDHTPEAIEVALNLLSNWFSHSLGAGVRISFVVSQVPDNTGVISRRICCMSKLHASANILGGAIKRVFEVEEDAERYDAVTKKQYKGEINEKQYS